MRSAKVGLGRLSRAGAATKLPTPARTLGAGESSSETITPTVAPVVVGGSGAEK